MTDKTTGSLRTASTAHSLPAPRTWLSLCLVGLLAACATKVQPPPEPPQQEPTSPLPPAPVEVLPPEPLPPLVGVPQAALASHAATPMDYRHDGARHLYRLNSQRIFKGQMPPLMHAVGVLQVDIDNLGQVRRLNWMRAPSHAPDVVLEIERTVKAAAPFPAPVRMGSVTYTEVWLWDKSGHFQLDTLTEGQRLR
jgi:protein TonB